MEDDSMKPKRDSIVAVCVAFAIVAAGVAAILTFNGVALAEGTGVNLTATPPPPSASEAKAWAVEEARYQSWLAGQSQVVTPNIIDAPHYYLSTPSHKQSKTYYCGPATCQIIDDYWHAPQTQAAYAAKYGMCTTTAGTNYYLMDDVLRYYTGKSSYNYYDYNSVTSATQVYSRTEYALGSKHFPLSYLVKVDGSTWANYVYDHSGHIICGEGFDWRYNHISINDPYPENDPAPPNGVGRGSSGGDTYGHNTYSRGTIANGVLALYTHGMIY
jgi:hypothetical protein